MYALDATPLIYLAKARQLDLLGELDGGIQTPETVYDEVVSRGIEEGYADARRIERAVENEQVVVVSIGATETLDRLRNNGTLSDADAAVLALADARNGTAAMDEAHGRAVADAEGIRARGTAYLVLRCLRDGTIGPDEARETIDAMVDAGWYCAPDLYARIRRQIKELA